MVDLKQLDIQYVTNQSGEKTAVILSLANFQTLVEDLTDLAVAASHNRPYRSSWAA